MKIHHIGYLISNLKTGMEEMLKFGGTLVAEPVFDEDRQVDIAFIKNGDVLIELVSPRSTSSDIGESLRKIGNIPYHICYECDDLESAILGLQSAGCILVKEPQKAIALEGRRVAFLFSENLGLFELLQ